MKQKSLTNRQALNKLIKELNEHELVILRERLLKINELTKYHLKVNPSDFNTPVFDHSVYADVCEKIDQTIGLSQ